MALPSSGTITINDIVTEFGGDAPHALSEYYRGGSYVTSNNTDVPTSGTIALSDFYDASKGMTGTNTANDSSTGSGATHTFSSQSLGTADASRIIVVTVGMGVNNANRTITGVSVAGDNMTLRVGAVGSNTGIENFRAEIWSVALASGTSGDVVVTLSGTIGGNRGVAISVYSLTGGVVVAPSATATDYDNTTTAPQLSANVNTVSAGYVIGVGTAFKVGGTATWGGLTEAIDMRTGNVVQTVANLAPTSTETPRTITLDYTTGTTGAQCVAVASWFPS
jgi:hypothetical protein